MPSKSATSTATANKVDQRQPLDRNHALIFKQLLQNYETKEYKKGIKNADTILKSYPSDGQTMAMKGLILTNMDKKEEGWECVRKGLRNDLKSHICWHVYGLLHRADKNYEESMKCYVNALKFDPDNIVVLRDLAVIQSQLRVLPGLIDTRRAILLRQPEVRGHHTALAVAYSLIHNYTKAAEVLTNFDEKMPIKPKNNVEHSMTTLFHNTVIAKTGDFDKALHHLSMVENQILDKLEILERRASYHIQQGNFEDALTVYERLLDINPDCHRYYIGLDKALQFRSDDGNLVPDAIAKISAKYIELQTCYPKSSAVKRLTLNWLHGQAFHDAAEQYIINLLQKGVPSTFVDVKALYRDSEKADVIERLVENYLATLRATTNGKTNGHTTFQKTADAYHEEPPTSYLWTLYFLAQSYDYRRNLTKASEFIDEALSHTPTLVELHLTKARILKHSGSARLAAEQMNIARELDLQDRFINTKCTKYYLRADQNADATNTIALFVNSTLGGGTIGDLQEMQSISFLVEDGLSYSRQGLFGLALKRFDSIKRTLDQWFEDQCDFHQYCFRKGTIDVYLSCMEWENSVYSHHIYKRAAEGAVRALLKIHRKPELKDGPEEQENVDEADKKKEKKRIQKIRLRCTKDATRVAEKKDGVDMHRKIDPDPLGDKLVATSTPLEDALTYLKPWLRDAPSDSNALKLAVEVYTEKSDFSNALKHLSTLDSRQAHYQLYRLRSKMESDQALSENDPALLKSLIDDRFDSQSTSEWNQQYLDSVTTTEQLLSGIAVCMLLEGPSYQQDVEKLILSHKLDMKKTTLFEAQTLHRSLCHIHSEHSENYWAQIKAIWYNVEK